MAPQPGPTTTTTIAPSNTDGGTGQPYALTADQVNELLFGFQLGNPLTGESILTQPGGLLADPGAFQFTPGAGSAWSGTAGALLSSTVTPDDVLRQAAHLSADEVIALQHKLYMAGMYADSYYSSHRAPLWGSMDNDTRAALHQAILEGIGSAAQGQSITAMLDQRAAELQANGGPGANGKSVLNPGNAYDIKTSDPAELRAIVDATGEKLLGRRVDAGERDSIVSSILGRQTGTAQTRIAAQQSVQAANAQAQADKSGGPAADAGDLDKFKAALKTQESGNYAQPPNSAGASGAYQFTPGTWGNYKGYAQAYLAPPDVQEERASQLIGSYFAEFGNWRDVAIAWYGGGGMPGLIAKGQVNPNSSQPGGPSINTYADSVMNLMSNGAGGGGAAPASSGSVTTVPDVVTSTTDPNPQADTAEAIRNAHPVEASAHDIAGAYGMFSQLLKGVV